MNIYKLHGYLLLCIFLIGCKKNEPSLFQISGKLDNMSNTSIILVREYLDSIYLDTIPVAPNGDFNYKDNINHITVASLFLDGKQISHHFALDKNYNIQVIQDSNGRNSVIVKGGDINDEFNIFNQEIKDLENKRNEELRLLELNKDSINEISYSNLTKINTEIWDKVLEYIKDNPNKISSVLIADQFLKEEDAIDRLSDALNSLKGEALDFPLTDKLKDYLNFIKVSNKGAAAPAMLSKDLDSKDFKINELRNKFILLCFVSAENNQFMDYYNLLNTEYKELKKGKSIRVVNKNLMAMEKREYNIKFVMIVKDIEENKLNIKNSNPDIIILPANDGWANQMFIDYNVTQTPYMFLINPFGRIEERGVSLKEIQPLLEKLPRGLINQ